MHEGHLVRSRPRARRGDCPHIARDSVEAAASWTIALFDEVERLADFPRSGKLGREVQTPGVREMVFGAYRLFYEVGSDVEVLTVRHGSQELGEDELRGD